MRRLLLPVVALVAGCPAAPPPPRPPPVQADAATVLPEPRADGRLPTLAVPTAYALTLDVDPTRPRFAGRVRIDVDVPERTSFVVLHGHALAIREAGALVGGVPIPAKVSMRSARGSAAAEELVLAFERALPRGRASLSLAWDAPFDDELSGLYRVEDGGRWYAFTQLESADARRAFPCFDEPSFKVPFELTVNVPQGMGAFANTPETSREERAGTDGGGISVRFAPTKPLPTYLVALAVGDFDVREARRAEHPPIRLVTTKGKSDLGELALEAAGSLVDVIARYLDVPYPYEKLDLVAVPALAAGAMENPGLVTFRDELLLLDPARASSRARRAQAATIAHELSHQWFGDLVTAAWWDDIWLNEGMATWMEWRAMERFQPAWSPRIDAVVSALGVMDQDGLASARAVRQPVVSSNDVHEAFDAITYAKGAAVLGTVEGWIGEDALRRGLGGYLKAHAHTSVRSSALLSALDGASGKDVTTMATGYLDHPGVPEISGAVTCDRTGRWSMEVNQERWRPLGSPIPEQSDHTWVVPVCVRAQGDRDVRCADLAHGAPSLVGARGSCPTWVHPNASSAYYRFSLGDAETVRLAEALPRADVAARVTALSNAWAAVRAGKTKPATLLQVLAAFDGDRSRHVVDQLVTVLSGASEALVDEEARGAFQKVVTARLGKRKKELGWSPDAEEDPSGERGLTRRIVLAAMGDLAEDEATLREAESIAARWLADATSVDSDVAAVAVDLASRRAGEGRLAELRAAARAAKTREDRLLALRAMAGFDAPRVLEQALDVSLSDEVRAHEVRYILGSAMLRRKARPVVDGWVRSRWAKLREKLPGSLAAHVVRAAGGACTKAEIAEREAFYRPRAAEIEGAPRRLAEALEAGTLCAALRERGAASFGRALRGEREPRPATSPR